MNASFIKEAYAPPKEGNKYPVDLSLYKRKGNLIKEGMYQRLVDLTTPGDGQGYYFGFPASYKKDGKDDVFSLSVTEPHLVFAILRVKGGLRPDIADPKGYIHGDKLTLTMLRDTATLLPIQDPKEEFVATFVGGKRRSKSTRQTKRVRRSKHRSSRRR